MKSNVRPGNKKAIYLQQNPPKADVDLLCLPRRCVDTGMLQFFFSKTITLGINIYIMSSRHRISQSIHQHESNNKKILSFTKQAQKFKGELRTNPIIEVEE